MDHLCYFCFVFVILVCPIIAALWSPIGKGLTSWLSFVMFNCVFVTSMWYPGSVWYLIPDLCHHSYFLESFISKILSFGYVLDFDL